jgi:sulfite reductase alpha subunit-like flavoprotein
VLTRAAQLLQRARVRTAHPGGHGLSAARAGSLGHYETGDHVAIYPDNDDAQVARLAARLGADIDAVVALEDGLRPARVLPSGSACAGPPRRCSPLDRLP